MKEVASDRSDERRGGRSGGERLQTLRHPVTYSGVHLTLLLRPLHPPARRKVNPLPNCKGHRTARGNTVHRTSVDRVTAVICPTARSFDQSGLNNGDGRVDGADFKVIETTHQCIFYTNVYFQLRESLSTTCMVLQRDAEELSTYADQTFRPHASKPLGSWYYLRL